MDLGGNMSVGSQKEYMRMTSQKSNGPDAAPAAPAVEAGAAKPLRERKARSVTAAKAPRRERGRLRVASLLEAAQAVFAEKGFEAATMTEIASRAKAPIGSLYQFFANKELLAGALLERYGTTLWKAMDRVAATAPGLTLEALSDQLMDTLVSLKAERTVALSLMEVAHGGPESAVAMKAELRGRVAGILEQCCPDVPVEVLRPLAIAFLTLMKSAAGLDAEPGLECKREVLEEYRAGARAFLAARLNACKAARNGAGKLD
jgi:AcrR family transcriptional regulator